MDNSVDATALYNITLTLNHTKAQYIFTFPFNFNLTFTFPITQNVSLPSNKNLYCNLGVLIHSFNVWEDIQEEQLPRFDIGSPRAQLSKKRFYFITFTLINSSSTVCSTDCMITKSARLQVGQGRSQKVNLLSIMANMMGPRGVE